MHQCLQTKKPENQARLKKISTYTKKTSYVKTWALSFSLCNSDEHTYPFFFISWIQYFHMLSDIVTSLSR